MDFDIKAPVLALVLPCYNEEEVLPTTISRLTEVLQELIGLQEISELSYMMFVDDGSSDLTWNIIEKNFEANKFIKGIKFSKNFGNQSALYAGMQSVLNKCDCLITIDADLQQDERSIINFIKKFKTGSEVVLGIRKSRKIDNIFTKLSSTCFYNLMNLMGVKIVKHHSEYRLLSNKANTALLGFNEVNLFIRGLVNLIGFKTDFVFFTCKTRERGKTKFSITKLISLALDGITSFSVVPLKFISVMGLLIFLISISMICYVFFIALFTEKSVPGWASTVLPIYFLGGIQIIFIGILGEYMGKIYKETKKRPLYFIEKKVGI